MKIDEYRLLHTVSHSSPISHRLDAPSPRSLPLFRRPRRPPRVMPRLLSYNRQPRFFTFRLQSLCRLVFFLLRNFPGFFGRSRINNEARSTHSGENKKKKLDLSPGEVTRTRFERIVGCGGWQSSRKESRQSLYLISLDFFFVLASSTRHEYRCGENSKVTRSSILLQFRFYSNFFFLLFFLDPLRSMRLRQDNRIH